MVCDGLVGNLVVASNGFIIDLDLQMRNLSRRASPLVASYPPKNKKMQ